MAEPFSEVAIGGIILPNRLIMAPVKTGYGSLNGEITHRQAAYYHRRAEGGVSAIVVEPMFIDTMGKEHPNQLGISTNKHIEGLKRLTSTIHDGGAIAIAHLNHAGRAANPKVSGTIPEAPSALPCTATGINPLSMTKERIDQIVKKFSGAARRAIEAGFDAIELQFGLGYLISQFISEYSNIRSDEYGGSHENRLRFGAEILESIRETIELQVPIIVRISASLTGDGTDLKGNIQLAQWLEGQGVAALHVVSGSRCDSLAWYFQHMRIPGDRNLQWASAIKAKVSIPVIAAGRLGDPQVIRKALSQEMVDIIALGRPLIVDPDLPKKIKSGNDEDIAQCGACMQGCLMGVKTGIGLTCIINPEVGKESELIKRAEHPGKIVVVGGGPAGMQAAVTAQSRGHKVTLFADDELGGQFNLAVIPPGKSEMKKPLLSLINRVRKSGIVLQLSTRASFQDINTEKPNVVILATGSIPKVPDVKGLDEILVSREVLLETKRVDSQVLIIGGGMVGLETAEYLAVKGHCVTVIEMLDEVASDMEPMTGKMILKNLKTYGVTIITGSKVKRFEGKKAIIDGVNGEITIGEFDTVVAAMGATPENSFERELRSTELDVHVIGDAKEPRNIVQAVSDGFELGKMI